MSLVLLLIKPDSPDAEFIIQTLSKVNPNINFEVVHDEYEGLDFLFRTGKYIGRAADVMPDLILLNLALPNTPDFAGLDVLRVIKSYARTRIIPVVILTDSPNDGRLLKSYPFSANSIIEKSSNRAQFRKALQAMSRFWLPVTESASHDAKLPSSGADSPEPAKS